MSKRKQGVDEALDRFRHAVGLRRLPDQAPLGGEIRVVGQLHARGDLGGVQRRRGEIGVHRIIRIEFGDRQRPDEIAEVSLGDSLNRDMA